MCQYRYVYYSYCQHPELTRTSYCFQAYSLGLPQRQDTYRVPHSQELHNGYDEWSGQSVYIQPRSPNSDRQYEHRSFNHSYWVMPKVVPSDAAMTPGSTIPIAPSNKGFCHSSLVPRSVDSTIGNPDLDGADSYYGHHQHLSQTSPSLDHATVNKLSIDIPLDPCSGFSLQLTHQDGDTQSHAISSTTKSDIQPSPLSFPERSIHGDDGDTVTRPMGKEGGYGLPTIVDNVAHQQIGGVEVVDTLMQKPRKQVGSIRPFKIEKKKADDSGIDDCKDDDSYSPRKPIPPQWTSAKGPMLATAQRAMQRESRKKITGESSPTSPKEASRAALRSTRSAIDLSRPHALDGLSFLTKTAAAAVESDITSYPLPRSSSKVQFATSKIPPKPSVRSLVRDSPNRNSAVKITHSSSKGSIPNLDGAGSSIPHLSGVHARSESNQSSVGGESEYLPAYSEVYDTANESSVSQSSSSSGISLSGVTSRPRKDTTLALEQTDVGKDVQNIDKDGTESRIALQNSRGRSKTHLRMPASTKCSLNRPAVPKLALRIPRSIPATTDRKSPLVLSSSSASPVTPNSSTKTSRIPVSASGNNGQAIASKPRSMRKREKAKQAATSSIPIGMSSTAIAIKQFFNHSDVEKESDGCESTETGSKRTATTLLRTRGSEKTRQDQILNFSDMAPTLSNFSQRDHEPDSPISNQCRPQDHHLHAIAPRLVVDTSTAKQYLPTEHFGARQEQGIEGPVADIFEERFSSDYVATEHPRYVEPRKVSETSTASDVTIKAIPADHDPIMRDSAIIFSRRRSDASGVSDTSGSLIDPATQEGTSTSFTTASAVSVTDRLKHLLRGSSRSRRLQAHSESAISEVTSSLRATAPVFVPFQIPQPTDPMSSENQNRPSAQFNSFQPDQSYGFPMYHYWYPVYLEPSQTLDFSNVKPKWSPMKKRRNRFNKFSGKKQNSDIFTPKPAGVSQPGQVSSLPKENGSTSAPEISTHPFANQMQFCEKESSVDADVQTENEARRIDWASIRNVPTYTPSTSRNMQFGHNTLPLRGRFAHYAHQHNLMLNNGTHNQHAGQYRSRKWGSITGVPLAETAPFPNPAPPPAPQSKGYIGYSVGQDCGNIEIVSAGEMIGGACNTCQPDH